VFDVASVAVRAERFAWVAGALSRPPGKPWIVRPELRGSAVVQFVLPLELCKTGNVQLQRGMAGQPWRVAKAKRQVADAMAVQCRPFDSPIGGRPQVVAIRFSSSEPDRTSDWSKHCIDVLCAKRKPGQKRLNIIQDDRPAVADVCVWWEPAPARSGLVFLEVRSAPYRQPTTLTRDVEELIR